MRKVLASIVPLLILAIGFSLACHHANAAVTATSPKAATCAAFAQWNHHRTTANLDHMVTASLSAPWRNLGTDVGVVYFDVRGGDHTDLAGDVAGIASDCR